MKIEAILEIIEPQVRSYDMGNRELGRDTTTDPVRQMGSGYFSKVDKDRDPHFVRKTSKNSERATRDGYWFFIKNVVDHKLWENPYFPRVYQFKKFYKGEEAHYRVQLEKLEDFLSISKKEKYAIGRKMFGDSQMKKIMDEEDETFSITSLIFNMMENLYDGEIHTAGLDKDLVSAMQTLRKMNKSDHAYDMGGGMNAMVRRGPTGLHLVITDPFGFR